MLGARLHSTGRPRARKKGVPSSGGQATLLAGRAEPTAGDWPGRSGTPARAVTGGRSGNGEGVRTPCERFGKECEGLCFDSLDEVAGTVSRVPVRNRALGVARDHVGMRAGRAVGSTTHVRPGARGWIDAAVRDRGRPWKRSVSHCIDSRPPGAAPAGGARGAAPGGARPAQLAGAVVATAGRGGRSGPSEERTPETSGSSRAVRWEPRCSAPSCSPSRCSC